MSLWEVLFRPSSSRSEKYQGEIASAWVLFLLSSWLMCFFHALFEPRRAQQMQHRWIDSLCTRIDAVHITYRWTMNFIFLFFKMRRRRREFEGLTSLDKMGYTPFFLSFSQLECFLFFFNIFRLPVFCFQTFPKSCGVIVVWWISKWEPSLTYFLSAVFCVKVKMFGWDPLIRPLPLVNCSSSLLLASSKFRGVYNAHRLGLDPFTHQEGIDP